MCLCVSTVTKENELALTMHNRCTLYLVLKENHVLGVGATLALKSVIFHNVKEGKCTEVSKAYSLTLF